MSWVANLFNSTQASRISFAPSNDAQPPAFSNVQDYEDISSKTYQKRQAGKYAQSMEVEEEEEEYDARNPYWQVSQHWSIWDSSAPSKSVLG